MSESLFLKYYDIKNIFDKNFIVNLIKVLLKDCTSFETTEHKWVNPKYFEKSLKSFNYEQEQIISFSFKTNKNYYFGLHIHGRERRVSITVHNRFIGSPERKFIETVSADMIKRSKMTYHHLRPSHAIAAWEYHEASEKGADYKQIGWLNFYSPELVTKIGEEKFRTLKLGTFEELIDGGMLVVRGKTPDDDYEYGKEIKRKLFGKSLKEKLLWKGWKK